MKIWKQNRQSMWFLDIPQQWPQQAFIVCLLINEIMCYICAHVIFFSRDYMLAVCMALYMTVREGLARLCVFRTSLCVLGPYRVNAYIVFVCVLCISAFSMIAFWMYFHVWVVGWLRMEQSAAFWDIACSKGQCFSTSAILRCMDITF